MSRRAPEYMPMCNKHLRFYFSNPNRTEFRSYIAEKQFRAVERAISSVNEKERKWLNAIIPGRVNNDLLDSYIVRNLRNSGATNNEIEKFFTMLRKVNAKIAIDLGYIEDNRKTIQWTCNF